MELLRDFRSWSLRTDVITYNAIISASDAQWQTALSSLRAVTSEGIEPSDVTYNAAVKASEHEWVWALVLLANMHRCHLRLHVITYNTAVFALDSSYGLQWERALELSRTVPASGMRRDSFTCAATVGACGSSLRWECALDVAAHALGCNVRPDAAAYLACTEALDASACWQGALSLLAMAALSCAVVVRALGAGISACARAGRWEWALTLLCAGERGTLGFSAGRIEQRSACRMMSGQEKADASAAHATAVSACGLLSQWTRCLLILRQLRSQQLVPNSVVVRSSLRACGHGRGWQSAISIGAAAANDMTVLEEGRPGEGGSEVWSALVWACEASAVGAPFIARAPDVSKKSVFILQGSSSKTGPHSA